jgi:nitrate reductase NapAB chaperone NapD
MAIAGLLVHTLQGEAEVVEQKIKKMNTMTSYGIHKDEFIVLVAEVHSQKIETEVKKIEGIDGVLTIYTTYVTVEDEE